MTFSINNKLVFFDSFQFLNSSSESLENFFWKNSSKYLSQEFDGELLDLVKQKGFYPYEYMNGFKKFRLYSIDKFYSSFNGKTFNNENYKHVPKV